MMDQKFDTIIIAMRIISARQGSGFRDSFQGRVPHHTIDRGYDYYYYYYGNIFVWFSVIV